MPAAGRSCAKGLPMLRRVYEAGDPVEAYLARDWLERNGIRATVRDQKPPGLTGEIPWVWPSVWVSASDEERARRALLDLEKPSLVHPEWICAHCLERNGPAFATCWSCGR
jgi:hypothetical protein